MAETCCPVTQRLLGELCEHLRGWGDLIILLDAKGHASSWRGPEASVPWTSAGRPAGVREGTVPPRDKWRCDVSASHVSLPWVTGTHKVLNPCIPIFLAKIQNHHHEYHLYCFVSPLISYIVTNSIFISGFFFICRMRLSLLGSYVW